MGKASVFKLAGVLVGVVLLGLSLPMSESIGQAGGPTTHTIFMTAMELKGSTTTDSLAAPSVNPKDLSKGYDFKPPGEFDKSDPKKWEVSSYVFSPGFVVVNQGDTVRLTVFVVNGNAHNVRIIGPDGRDAVASVVWNRGLSLRPFG